MQNRTLVDQDFTTIGLASGSSMTISSKLIIQNYSTGLTVAGDSIFALSINDAMQVWHIECNEGSLLLGSLRAVVTQYMASIQGPGWTAGQDTDVSALLLGTEGEISFSPKSSSNGYLTLTLTNYSPYQLTLFVRSSLYGHPTFVTGNSSQKPLTTGDFTWGGE